MKKYIVLLSCLASQAIGAMEINRKHPFTTELPLILELHQKNLTPYVCKHIKQSDGSFFSVEEALKNITIIKKLKRVPVAPGQGSWHGEEPALHCDITEVYAAIVVHALHNDFLKNDTEALYQHLPNNKNASGVITPVTIKANDFLSAAQPLNNIDYEAAKALFDAEKASLFLSAFKSKQRRSLTFVSTALKNFTVIQQLGAILTVQRGNQLVDGPDIFSYDITELYAAVIAHAMNHK